MGTILPLHSPAVSGGGVSENIFKDMMNEMQGGSGPATVAQIEGTGPAAESKKAKKKVKA
jgi:signal recognition particle subunit SRP19